MVAILQKIEMVPRHFEWGPTFLFSPFGDYYNHFSWWTLGILCVWGLTLKIGGQFLIPDPQDIWGAAGWNS